MGYVITSEDRRADGVLAYIPCKFYDGKKLNNGFDLLYEQLPKYIESEITTSNSIANEANKLITRDIKPGEEVEEVYNL